MSSEDVHKFSSAPEPFDLAFIKAMIPHHQMAIEAAQLVLQQAVHPEIKDMARSIIDAQQKEIDQMTTRRSAWYGATANASAVAPTSTP